MFSTVFSWLRNKSAFSCWQSGQLTLATARELPVLSHISPDLAWSAFPLLKHDLMLVCLSTFLLCSWPVYFVCPCFSPAGSHGEHCGLDGGACPANLLGMCSQIRPPKRSPSLLFSPIQRKRAWWEKQVCYETTLIIYSLPHCVADRTWLHVMCSRGQLNDIHIYA